MERKGCLNVCLQIEVDIVVPILCVDHLVVSNAVANDSNDLSVLDLPLLLLDVSIDGPQFEISEINSAF